MTIYVGLDTATTTGLAVWFPTLQKALVSQCKGTPLKQLKHIQGYVFFPTPEVVIAMESIHNFRNANVTRSLLERYGFLKYSLLAEGFRVEEIPPKMARRSLGVNSKREAYEYLSTFCTGKLTDNHTDALAIALYQALAEGHLMDPSKFVVELGGV